MNLSTKSRSLSLAVVTGILLLSPGLTRAQEPLQDVIVQGQSVAVTSTAVLSVGGQVTDELEIINAVGAMLTDTQIETVSEMAGVDQVYANGNVSNPSAGIGDAGDITSQDDVLTNQDGELSFGELSDGALSFGELSDGELSYGDSSGGEALEGPVPGLRWPVAVDSRSYGPALVGATRLHRKGITGAGVTLAILDTGLWDHTALTQDSGGRFRIKASYDAIANDEGIEHNATTDEHGHGTHLATIVADSQRDIDGAFRGAAPDVQLVIVKSFDADAQGSYLDVLRGLNWILVNRDRYDIRVLNLSFSAPPRSYYWDDPINQAVMRLWQAGVVVVASAGNTGPDPMSIRVPGNTPYVITVGATADNDTPSNGSDDMLAKFSSAGPTVEGFVKPDFLAPGSLVGLLPSEDCVVMSMLAMSDAGFCQISSTEPLPVNQFDTTSTSLQGFGTVSWTSFTGGSVMPSPEPEPTEQGNYQRRSGTSQATALVSGIVALMIQADPSITPDEVKFRLMAGSRPAVDSNGRFVYSVF
jgi:subtilisin family serine protease